jgi:tetrahydromethanopterin S-methyltransferase subunit G
MPVEHPPVSSADVWFAADDLHEVCEELRALQHEAEFTVGMNQIGELTQPFGKHVGMLMLQG